MAEEENNLDTNGWVPDENPLDSGANSVVFLARRDGEVAVIKICSAWKPDSERYQRFAGEIRALEEFSEDAGVMPVIDSSIPDPGKGRFPWYVMPEATPLSKRFPESPLDDVVPALAAIAKTLQAMHDGGYSHRDVKPSNLFVMADGPYVVGDLGLVGVPEEVRESMTQQGGAVGPANFMAPEMREWQPDTDAFAADVYSLLKTLWALVARRRYPLPGHQRADDQESLVALTGDERAAGLDRLIERATDHDPSRRPTMAEVADELEAWVETDTDTSDAGEDELTAAVASARERLADHRSAAASEAADRNAAEAAYYELIEAMEPVFSALEGIGTSHNATTNDPMLDATIGHPFLEETGRPLILSRRQTFHYAEVMDGVDGARLAVAAAVGHQEDRTVICAVGILVYSIPPTIGGTRFTWDDRSVATIGSLAVSREIARLASEARDQMPAALTAFIDIAGTR